MNKNTDPTNDISINVAYQIQMTKLILLLGRIKELITMLKSVWKSVPIKECLTA
jgi:hypothetical protein